MDVRTFWLVKGVFEGEDVGLGSVRGRARSCIRRSSQRDKYRDVCGGAADD